MKYQVKIAITSFFILFLSLCNLKNGLILKTTDNTERDAFYTNFEQKTDNKSEIKSSLASVNIPKQTVKQATAKTSSSSGSKTLNLTGVKTVSKNCNTDMSVMSSGAYYCNYRGSASTFIYGHNKAGTFGTLYTLKAGDLVKIKIGGAVKTYKVVNSFRLEYNNLKGSSNSGLRTSLYQSTYGNKWGGAAANKRITFQTCEGKNDNYRRYIQAVEV